MSANPEEAMAKMVASLEAKTGKSIDQWAALVEKSGKDKHGEMVSWLKEEHGITHGYANLIAHYTRKSDALSVTSGGTDLVATQYEGARAGLKPIYDRVIEVVQAFGPDVEIAPKKQYVSLPRSKQFAIVQPSATRADVGLVLKGVAAQGRLETAGSFNSMMTHRVRIGNVGDVDSELVAWLRKAYEGA
jgi:hypothetical protein